MKKNIYIFSKKKTEGSKDLVKVLGGKGANQAIALNKESIKVKFISAIGDDFFSEFFEVIFIDFKPLLF